MEETNLLYKSIIPAAEEHPEKLNMMVKHSAAILWQWWLLQLRQIK